MALCSFVHVSFFPATCNICTSVPKLFILCLPSTCWNIFLWLREMLHNLNVLLCWDFFQYQTILFYQYIYIYIIFVYYNSMANEREHFWANSCLFPSCQTEWYLLNLLGWYFYQRIAPVLLGPFFYQGSISYWLGYTSAILWIVKRFWWCSDAVMNHQSNQTWISCIASSILLCHFWYFCARCLSSIRPVKVFLCGFHFIQFQFDICDSPRILASECDSRAATQSLSRVYILWFHFANHTHL